MRETDEIDLPGEPDEIEESETLEMLRHILFEGGFYDELVQSHPMEDAKSVGEHYQSQQLILRGYRCPHCFTNRVYADNGRTPLFMVRENFIFCNNCGTAAWFPADVQRAFVPRIG